MSKNFILVIIIVFILLILGIGYYRFWWFDTHQVRPVACTQEAKLCPDGSYVGRTGPNCEFAECPEIQSAKCEQASDCELVYTGLGYCPPCDYNSEEYKEYIKEFKCLSPADAKKIRDEWIQKNLGASCQECPSELSLNIACSCNSGICVKTENIDVLNWQTYRNEEYGFEVKYPAEWYYTDMSPKAGRTATYNGMPYEFQIYFSDEKDDGVPPSRGGRGFISIMIYSGNMAELDAKEAEQGQYGAFNSQKKMQTTFNGLDAVKIEYNIRVPESAPSTAFSCEQLRFEHNNKAFAIDFENSEKTTLLNQIYLNFLSTFKFISQ